MSYKFLCYVAFNLKLKRRGELRHVKCMSESILLFAFLLLLFAPSVSSLVPAITSHRASKIFCLLKSGGCQKLCWRHTLEPQGLKWQRLPITINRGKSQGRLLSVFCLPNSSPIHLFGRAQIISETLLAMEYEICCSQVSSRCKTGEIQEYKGEPDTYGQYLAPLCITKLIWIALFD